MRSFRSSRSESRPRLHGTLERPGAQPDAQVSRIYQVAFARPPTEEEHRLGIRFLERKPAKNESSGKGVLVHYCHAIMGLNEFIYVH